MTEPAATTTTEPTTDAPTAALPATPASSSARRRRRLAAAVGEGTVALYLLRSSGRTRHVPYLPKADRPAVAALRTEGKDKTLSVVAAEHGLSLSTLRRRLLALEVSEAVDAGKFDSLWDGTADKVVFVRGAE
ncbi:MAG: hypothetical protein M3Q22_01485 [Actinomycetota bacterium]|nr:hypothetical protein [Actinomycetota bacterium]